MAIGMKLAAALALAATGTAVPAQAQGACWATRDMQAASVRQMQTMLMVAALRCKAAGIDVSADYNSFVTVQKEALAAEDMVIKRHFANAGGTQSDYDHFTTALANGYGDGQTSEASCAEASALAHDGAAVASLAALESMANARIFPAALPGGSCEAPAAATLAAAAPAAGPTPAAAPVVVASATPAAALPPIIPLAAPIEPVRPVSLPADVVAAMTVLARFQVAQAAAPAAPASTATLVASAAH